MVHCCIKENEIFDGNKLAIFFAAIVAKEMRDKFLLVLLTEINLDPCNS